MGFTLLKTLRLTVSLSTLRPHHQTEGVALSDDLMAMSQIAESRLLIPLQVSLALPCGRAGIVFPHYTAVRMRGILHRFDCRERYVIARLTISTAPHPDSIPSRYVPIIRNTFRICMDHVSNLTSTISRFWIAKIRIVINNNTAIVPVTYFMMNSNEDYRSIFTSAPFVTPPFVQSQLQPGKTD